MDDDFSRLIDDALHGYWQREPVTATFAGDVAFNGCLPRADALAESVECGVIDALAQRLARTAIPDTAAARLDARHLDAYCALARSDYARRARYRNPAWYTGEASFGLISLLLAGDDCDRAALEQRLLAIPDFFADGTARLAGVPLPAAWAQRARTELGALKRLLQNGFPLHPASSVLRGATTAAIGAACDRFAAAIASADDADAACGSDHLATIVQRVHGLDETLPVFERRAADAFAELLDRLQSKARQLDPAVDWRGQIARLSEIGPAQCAAGDVLATYRHWHERALQDAQTLLTPATAPLAFRFLPDWARPVAADLYFLFYRSPVLTVGGAGATYWVWPPDGSPADVRRAHNTATVKLVHAVHHASIGHHTQNSRARTAHSRFARMAGIDGAGAIALLAGGTMIEGWACYAEELMAEIPGFYTAAEQLQLTYFALRNIASTLADVRFHSGTYSLDEMRAFYRDDAAFAPGRIDSETTRNSMYPGSRLMYWSGTRRIRALRAATPLTTKAFHDVILSYGATPIAWIADELARRGTVGREPSAARSI